MADQQFKLQQDLQTITELKNDHFDLALSRITVIATQANDIQNKLTEILRSPSMPLDPKMMQDLQELLDVFNINASDFTERFAEVGNCEECGKPFIHRKGVVPYCERPVGDSTCCAVAWVDRDDPE